jgi:hypothetical protein
VVGTAPGATANALQTEDMEKMIEEMYERSRAAAAGAGG